jgi:hypothetical protein
MLLGGRAMDKPIVLPGSYGAAASLLGSVVAGVSLGGSSPLAFADAEDLPQMASLTELAALMMEFILKWEREWKWSSGKAGCRNDSRRGAGDSRCGIVESERMPNESVL